MNLYTLIFCIHAGFKVGSLVQITGTEQYGVIIKRCKLSKYADVEMV